MYEFVVPIRLTLMDQMAHVAREQGKTLVPLNDDLTAGPQWTSPPAELTDILASEIAAWERQRNDSAVDQMDVHNRESPRQNGPRLPQAHRRQNALAQRVIITVPRY